MRDVLSGDSAFQDRPGHNGSARKGVSPGVCENPDSANLFELFFAASCQLNVPELSSYEKQWSRAAWFFCASQDENRIALSSVSTVEATPGGSRPFWIATVGSHDAGLARLKERTRRKIARSVDPTCSLVRPPGIAVRAEDAGVRAIRQRHETMFSRFVQARADRRVCAPLGTGLKTMN